MEQLLGLPPDGSAHGPAIDNLIGLLHWLMLVLFVGWGIFYVYTLIRFRKSKNPVASYTGVKSHFSKYAEIGVIVVEAILLVGFSIPLWSNRVDDFPDEKDATVVRVVAEQFSWNIHYPGPDGKFGKTSITLVDSDNPLGLDRSDADAKDDITTINQFNLPVDRNVIVHLSSKDVIHSFGLPAYRVKQDAIPGMSIPVWFRPVKTTDQIRDEMTHSFSIAHTAGRVRTLSLPALTTVAVAKGSSKPDLIFAADYADTAGTSIVTKGDRLTLENMDRLADAGVREVSARTPAGIDKYVALEETKDANGEVAVALNEQLTEDAVGKLVAAGKKEIKARQSSNMESFILMESYSDGKGTPLAQKGDMLGEDVITKLAEGGVPAVRIAPSTPTEIACAQLCGLGHYKMRGFMTVQTAEDFKKWFDEQEAAVNPDAAPAESTAAN